jgi:hypothetical protein
MEKSQLKCEKCTNDGILIVASVDNADRPNVYCADHLVEYAQSKKAIPPPEENTAPSLFDAVKALRDARLANYEQIQTNLQSESLKRELNHAAILSKLEEEKVTRKTITGDKK